MGERWEICLQEIPWIIINKKITLFKCQCILRRALIGDTFQIKLEFRRIITCSLHICSCYSKIFFQLFLEIKTPLRVIQMQQLYAFAHPLLCEHIHVYPHIIGSFLSEYRHPASTPLTPPSPPTPSTPPTPPSPLSPTTPPTPQENICNITRCFNISQGW